MSTRALDELNHILCEELDDIAKKGDLSAGELDIVHKLTDTIKNIHKIKYMEENGYSGDTDWEMRGNTYPSRTSFAGRRRDMRGRYSSRSDGYSYADAKHEMLENLEDMMDTAESDKTRDAIKRCMDVIRNS